MIAPVSGSIKVKNEGIKVIKKRVIVLTFLMLNDAIERIKDNFISSLGWNDKPNNFNQALEPLILSPIKSTRRRRKTEVK